MPAYLVANIEVTDPDGSRYVDGVPATIEAFGGRYVARGGEFEVLEGDLVEKGSATGARSSFARPSRWTSTRSPASTSRRGRRGTSTCSGRSGWRRSPRSCLPAANGGSATSREEWRRRSSRRLAAPWSASPPSERLATSPSPGPESCGGCTCSRSGGAGGAGRALLDSATEHLRAQGYDQAMLWVLDDNPRARRFYERCGWQADGGVKIESHLGIEVAEVRYRRTLQ